MDLSLPLSRLLVTGILIYVNQNCYEITQKSKFSNVELLMVG